MKIKIIDGEIKAINPKQEIVFKTFIQKANNNGKVYDLFFEEESVFISDKQKNLYSAIVIKVAEETGNDYVDIDKHLQNFLPQREEETIVGTEILKVKFDNMYNYEFQKFIEDILAYIKDFFNIKMSLDITDGITQIMTK